MRWYHDNISNIRGGGKCVVVVIGRTSYSMVV